MIALAFYTASAVAIIATIAVVMSRNPIYAILNLIVSFFAVALVFACLGAPFMALLEVIVYAGAIMVLFLFVVMMLNLSKRAKEPDLQPPTRRQLLVPGLLALALAAQCIVLLIGGPATSGEIVTQSPRAIGNSLYGTHYLGVELASLVLLLGIIGGMHLGRAASEPDTKEGHFDSVG